MRKLKRNGTEIMFRKPNWPWAGGRVDYKAEKKNKVFKTAGRHGGQTAYAQIPKVSVPQEEKYTQRCSRRKMSLN